MICRTATLLLATLVAGCASTSAEPGFHSVANIVQERTSHRLRWNQLTPDDRKVDDAVRALIAKPLTVDGAVQIALLRNPTLQATYEELSLAQADVVQAGLLSNPVFSADITTAEREALDPNLILGVTQSFFDLLLIPAKKKIAASAFEQVKFRVGNAILEFSAQAQTAYFVVVGAEQTFALRSAITEAEQASYELTERQRDAGNVSDLTFASEKALYQQTRLDLEKSAAELATSRELLTRIMGLWGTDAASWRTPARLPAVPSREPALDHLESRAIAQRLDVAAVRQEVETLRYALNLAKTSRWTGLINVGANVARLKDGHVVVGPTASIELPVFDQRQGTVARIEAQLRTSESMLAAQAITTRSEVRAARERLTYARQLVLRYRNDIIPTREQMVALTQQEYDAMLAGVYQLVQAKQNEIGAYREYIDAVRDYWTAHTELERAVGGRVRLDPAAKPEPPMEPAPSAAPAPTAPVPTEHHQHP